LSRKVEVLILAKIPTGVPRFAPGLLIAFEETPAQIRG
jgi:hypothetical protein